MKQKKAAILMVLISLFVMDLTSMAGTLEEEKEHEALQTAESWILLVDAGQYEKSWEEASSFFKTQVSKETWVSEISRLRPLFGPTKSRTLLKTKYMTSAPGAPDGEYVLILFNTSFEKKEKAIETVTPMRDADGVWRVSGYFIR
jgi:hypothetical protein